MFLVALMVAIVLKKGEQTMADPGILEVVLKGLAAGVVGTTAMTLSEKLEQQATGRPDSLVTAQVGAHIASPKLETGADAARLGKAVHWMHGVTWGALRGLLALTPLSIVTASAVHYVALWTSDVGLYRVLKIEPLPHKWKKQALVVDLFHKFVLSAVTTVVFLLLLEL